MGISTVLVLLVGVTVTVIHYVGKVRRQNVQELVAVSRTVPNVLDAMGSDLASQARVISMSREFRDYIINSDHQALFAYLAQFLFANHLDFVEITDSSGRVVLNLADSLVQGEPSANPLVETSLSGSPYSHGILRIHDQIHIVATVPIFERTKPLGTITLGKTFDQDLMRKLGHVPGVDLAIWKNPDRVALVLPGSEPLPPLSEVLEEDEMIRVLDGKAIVKNVKYGGNTVTCAFFTLSELDGRRVDICATYRSMSFLKEAGLLTLVHSVALFLLVLLLVVQFTWWISKRVTQPLAELSGAARRLANLDFSEEVPVEGSDEISDLTMSFNNVIHVFKENITKKDSYASELAELNERLERTVAQRTEELEHINLRLKREMVEKNDFLRAVSHDLGAPLRNIVGLARILERKFADVLGEEGKDRIGRICSNVKREQEMIEQLLDLSRIMNRRGHETVIDLMDLLAQIRQDLSYSIEEKGIRIVVLDVLPMVKAEKDRIRQLFQNLIDNAIKYMGDQECPEIEIGWSEEPDKHLFWVRDNGMGIPEDHKDKIFGIFQRVKNKEVSTVAGKGVGLASVKTIVEMYGGDVWVESQPGYGSCFYFTMNRSMVDPKAASEEADLTEEEGTFANIHAEDSVD